MFIKDEIDLLTPGPDLNTYLLQQLEEQVGSVIRNLLDVARDILFSEEDWLDKKSTLCKVLFEVSLQIKRLLHDKSSSPSMMENRSQVKLSKNDVPTFDGNSVNWATFW